MVTMVTMGTCSVRDTCWRELPFLRLANYYCINLGYNHQHLHYHDYHHLHLHPTNYIPGHFKLKLGAVLVIILIIIVILIDSTITINNDLLLDELVADNDGSLDRVGVHDLSGVVQGDVRREVQLLVVDVLQEDDNSGHIGRLL